MVAAIFGTSLDAGSTAAEMPLMLLRSITLALVVWTIGRFVLNGNALAWPLAIFLAIALQNAAALDQNRSDLRMNAIVILIGAAIALLWMIVTPSESEGPGGAGGALYEPTGSAHPPKSLANARDDRHA